FGGISLNGRVSPSSTSSRSVRSAAGGMRTSIASKSHPAEDLTTLGQVPVAERLGGDQRRGGPRAAAEHLVALAEEDLGVLGIRVRLEAGIAVELRRRQ